MTTQGAMQGRTNQLAYPAAKFPMETTGATSTTQSLPVPGVFAHLQDATTRTIPIVLGVCISIILVVATLVTLLILWRKRLIPPLIKKWKNGSEQVHTTSPTQVITLNPMYENSSRTFDTSRAVYDRCSDPAHNRQDVAEEDTYDHLHVRNIQLHRGQTYSSSGVLPPAQVRETCTDLTYQDDTYSHLVKPIGSHAPPVMISATAAVETQAGADEPVYSLIPEAVEDSYSQPADSPLATQQPIITGITLATNQGDEYSQPADSLLVDQHLGTAGAISSISQSDTYIEPANSLLGDKQLSTSRVATSCVRRCVQANTAVGSKFPLHDTSKKVSSTFRQEVDGMKTREKGVGTKTGAITGGRTSTDDMPTSTVGKVPLHDSCADAVTAVNNVYSQEADVLAEPTGGPMRCHRVSRVANIPPTLPGNTDIVTMAISEASSTDYLIRSDMAITSALASSAAKSSQAKENDIHGVGNSADVIIYDQLLDQGDDCTTTADGIY